MNVAVWLSDRVEEGLISSYPIRCAGGDGNLLLNVGPTPEGTIRQVEQDNYRRMGEWLKKYGESIYATRGGPYKPAHWGMSTRTDKAIYLHVLQHWPDGVLEIADPGLKVVKAEALTGGDLRFLQKEDPSATRKTSARRNLTGKALLKTHRQSASWWSESIALSKSASNNSLTTALAEFFISCLLSTGSFQTPATGGTE